MRLSLIIMGVAGCGKTSVGEALQDRTGMPFIDGDSLHPRENIAKMSAGISLEDADRWPWLTLVGQEIAASTTPISIGCSALKRAYRDSIRRSAKKPVGFVHLLGDRTVIEKRMQLRQGHFMPTSLLDSQFATLEPLQGDETGFTVNVDQALEQIIDAIVQHDFD
ncbi:MAG: gluconokinase [Burkholderiaceae bacterium]